MCCLIAFTYAQWCPMCADVCLPDYVYYVLYVLYYNWIRCLFSTQIFPCVNNFDWIFRMWRLDAWWMRLDALQKVSKVNKSNRLLSVLFPFTSKSQEHLFVFFPQLRAACQLCSISFEYSFVFFYLCCMLLCACLCVSGFWIWTQFFLLFRSKPTHLYSHRQID